MLWKEILGILSDQTSLLLLVSWFLKLFYKITMRTSVIQHVKKIMHLSQLTLPIITYLVYFFQHFFFFFWLHILHLFFRGEGEEKKLQSILCKKDCKLCCWDMKIQVQFTDNYTELNKIFNWAYDWIDVLFCLCRWPRKPTISCFSRSQLWPSKHFHFYPPRKKNLYRLHQKLNLKPKKKI